jgi:nucleotide-binding universal stress UspA family protein
MPYDFLFPTDFSPCAEHAFSHAAHLAARYDARLHILSVTDEQDESVPNPMTYLPLGRDELAAELGIRREPEADKRERDAGQISTVNVTISDPSPWRAILTYSEENDVDLIIMGTHGRHGVDRMLMGSVAEQVVRRARCPVLTVRASATTEGHTGPILVPIDFSTFTDGTIAQAIELARAYQSDIRLVHVVEPITLPSVYGVDPMPAMIPDMEARAREALEELGARKIGGVLHWTAQVLVGHATHEIVTEAEEVGARMIVIATHGLTGFKRLLMGSVTEQVVREASCPVFTVRSFGHQLNSEPEAAEVVDDIADR